jgi:YVTN family beta-propeller protein
MGIHTGEPVVGEEGYHGLGLHRGARICSAGHGGQILLSNVTTGLVEDEAVDLVDLGAHRLKDIDRPERLAQVVYPGMPPAFPPLKTAEETPFEGREDVLAKKVASRFGWARPRRSRALVVLAAVLVAVAGGALLLTRGGGDDGSTLASLTEDSLGILSPDGSEAASVAVGTSPSAVAVGEGSIWVASADAETVSRIDPGDQRVTQTIPVGHSPQGVAVAGGFVWVSNGLDGTVSQIDPRIGGGKVIQEVRVGNQPTAVVADGDAVWVANSTDGTVSRIDAGTGKVGGPFKIGGGADAIAVGEGAVWVVSERSATVTSLDPKTGEALEQISVGQGPTAVAVGAGAVWVANTLDGTVSKLDPARGAVAATVPLGREPRGVAASKTAVWVSDESGRVARISPATASVSKVVVVGNRPSALAIDGDGLYVALRAAGPAHRGGVLRLVSQDLFDSFDPAIAYSGFSWVLQSNIYNGLVAFRRTGGSAGNQLVPDLAAAIPRPTAGGRTYTFRLRPGLRYSDGRPVLAGDVRHSIERNFSLKQSVAPQYLRAVIGVPACMRRLGAPCDLSRGIRTSDATGTITFRLTRPDPDLLYKLALPWAFVLPRTTPPRELDGGVPGTGPYKIARKSDDAIEFVRNPRFKEWSHAARPDGYPDRIEVRTGVKIGDQITTVDQGTADFSADSFDLPRKEKARLSTLRASQVHVSPSRATQFVFLNTERRPFDDVRVRRAVNLVVDRSVGLRSRIDGVETCQLLPPGFVGYRKYCPFPEPPDIAAARRLVRASGTTGAHVSLWSPGLPPASIHIAEVARALRTLGYRVSIRKFKGYEDYFETVMAPGAGAQAGWNGWIADYPAPSGFITPLVECGGESNLSHFCDREIDRLARRAAELATTDQQASSEQWARVDHRLTDAGAIVAFVNVVDFAFVSKRVRNFQAHPQWGVLLDQLWVR